MPLPQEIVDALPEDYRQDAIVREATDVASVVKMAIDGQKELGSRIRVPGPDADQKAREAFHADLVRKVPGLTMIPGADASDEQRNQFWQAVGRPKTAEGYSIEKIKLPEGLPKDYEIPKELIDQGRELAFRRNMTQEQFEGSIQDFLDNQALNYKSQQDTARARSEKLKETFGAAEEAKRNAALRAAEKFGGPEFRAELEANGTPEQWIAWSAAGSAFAETGGLDVTGQGPSSNVLSPSEAQRRINEIYGNTDHAYHKNTRSGHADAVFEMFNLQRQKMGHKPMSRADYDSQFSRGGRFTSSMLGTTVG